MKSAHAWNIIARHSKILVMYSLYWTELRTADQAGGSMNPLCPHCYPLFQCPHAVCGVSGELRRSSEAILVKCAQNVK